MHVEIFPFAIGAKAYIAIKLLLDCLGPLFSKKSWRVFGKLLV
jgi:hypothetical protein